MDAPRNHRMGLHDASERYRTFRRFYREASMANAALRDVWLEDDVREYLLREANRSGETLSVFLRRHFNLPQTNGVPTAKRPNALRETDSRESAADSDLAEYLSSPDYRSLPNPTERFGHILGFVYKRDPNTFMRVLELRDRKRHYFGRGPADFEDIKSPHPKPIPEAPFWFDARNDTRRKRERLDKVLRTLGYGSLVRQHATRALG